MSAVEDGLHSEAVAGTPQPPSLRRNRDFLLLWSGQSVSVLGSQVSQFASPLLVLILTGSPGLAGLVASLVAFPIVFLGLPAGVLVDRWNRKRMMIICDVCRAIALGSIPLAYALGHLTILQLIVAGLVEGASFSFFTLAEVSCLPQVVPKKQLNRAYSLNAIATNIAYTSGPALSGWLFSLWRALPFAFDALSYAVSVASLTRIKRSFQQERTNVVPLSLRVMTKEVGEGIRWLWQQRLLRFLLLAAFAGNAVTNGLLLLLIYEGTTLHAPAYATGILLAIYGAGGIVGATLSVPLEKMAYRTNG